MKAKKIDAWVTRLVRSTKAESQRYKNVPEREIINDLVTEGERCHNMLKTHSYEDIRTHLKKLISNAQELHSGLDPPHFNDFGANGHSDRMYKLLLAETSINFCKKLLEDYFPTDANEKKPLIFPPDLNSPSDDWSRGLYSALYTIDRHKDMYADVTVIASEVCAYLENTRHPQALDCIERVKGFIKCIEGDDKVIQILCTHIKDLANDFKFKLGSEKIKLQKWIGDLAQEATLSLPPPNTQETPKNNMSSNQRTLIFYYALKHWEIDHKTAPNRTLITKFIHATLGEKLDQPNNSTYYKRLGKAPNTLKDANLIKDLEKVKGFFISVKWDEVVEAIENELKIAREEIKNQK